MSNPTRVTDPRNMSFEYWFNTLTTNFPNDIIPIVYSDDDWKRVGNVMADSPTFSQYGIPNTELFDKWQDWAERVYALLG